MAIFLDFLKGSVLNCAVSRSDEMLLLFSEIVALASLRVDLRASLASAIFGINELKLPMITAVLRALEPSRPKWVFSLILRASRKRACTPKLGLTPDIMFIGSRLMDWPVTQVAKLSCYRNDRLFIGIKASSFN